jgi:hypothetical protein
MWNKRQEVYNKLKQFGIITATTSDYYHSWGNGFAHYYFITDKGLRIDGDEKVGSIETYNQSYRDSKVIYNPLNPKEHLMINEYYQYLIAEVNPSKYNWIWKLSFDIVGGLVTGRFFSGVIIFLFILYLRLKPNRNLA